MTQFTNTFKRILQEDLNDDPTSDREAMASTLDDGSEPEDYDVSAPSQQAQRMGQIAYTQMVEQLRSWITNIEDFVEFLNGTDTQESVQALLHSASPDTIFEKIANAETKKIARVAMELSALSEAFKGYLVASNDPNYRDV